MSEEIQKITEKIVPILKQAGVKGASIFGSVARGEADEKSDVDILIDAPSGMGLFGLLGLKADLERTLGKKVDLGTYSSVKPFLKDIIFSQQIRIL